MALERGDYVTAIVPIRPFDTYYFSFAKGSTIPMKYQS